MNSPIQDLRTTNCGELLRIHVVIATCGRAETTGKLVSLLENQTRPANGVVVVGTCDADVAGVAEASSSANVMLGPRGLCCQRNIGIEAVRDDADIVVFFDDDFVPANTYLEAVETLMAGDRTIAGLTGLLVDDGINHEPIAFEEAKRRLYDAGERPPRAEYRQRFSLYGCNMAIRIDSLGELRFDEALPLYGWMEDVDLTFQLGQRGRLIEAAELTGIHLGSRSGRQSGRRLGYSQVANIVYMYRKGTMPPDTGWCKLRRNLAANLVKSIRPEPHVDRRGRLKGNLLALVDLLRGQLDPGRIVSL
ncbi:MAG: glycosyltransferase family 2 protein [Novosphingobium sp.]